MKRNSQMVSLLFAGMVLLPTMLATVGVGVAPTRVYSDGGPTEFIIHNPADIDQRFSVESIPQLKLTPIDGYLQPLEMIVIKVTPMGVGQEGSLNVTVRMWPASNPSPTLTSSASVRVIISERSTNPADRSSTPTARVVSAVPARVSGVATPLMASLLALGGGWRWIRRKHKGDGDA